MNTRQIHVHRDADEADACDGYLVVLTLSTDILVEVVVYEVVGRSVPENEVLLPRKGAIASGDHASGIDDAEVYLRGDIKWDGCSNWSFDNGGTMLHFCGPENAVLIGEVFRRVYNIAKEMLDTKADW